MAVFSGFVYGAKPETSECFSKVNQARNETLERILSAMPADLYWARRYVAEQAEWLELSHDVPTGASCSIACIPEFGTLPDITTEHLGSQLPAFASAIAFSPWLWPLIVSAADRVQPAMEYYCGSGAASVRLAFERTLLNRLSEVSALALYEMFDTFRTTLPNEPRDSFELFCQKINIVTIGSNYPVLHRRICQTISNFSLFSMGLFEHLQSDISRLSLLGFGFNTDEAVKDIKFDLSDPHNGGKTVCLIEFESGRKIIYKPKPMANDVGYLRFISTLNTLLGQELLKAPLSLDCGEYGWSEFVQYRPCESTQEQSMFYEGFGALLAAQYLLCGTDMHLENIIAVGRHPVPIDFEALVYPKRTSRQNKNHHAGLYDSVLETGMLPVSATLDGAARDVSAFAAEKINASAPRSTFDNVNTGKMQLVGRMGAFEPKEHLPAAKESLISDREKISHLLNGFTAVYGVARRNRDALKIHIKEFAGNKVRFINRPTHVYDRMLRRLLRPAALRDEICAELDAGLLLTSMTGLRKIPECDDCPVDLSLYQKEVEDLLNGDIPMFHCHSDGEALIHRNSLVSPIFFKQSGVTRSLLRLDQLSVESLALQCEIIRASIDLSAPSITAQSSWTSPKRDYLAKALANELITRQAKPNDRISSWISLGAGNNVETVRLNLGDRTLYGGDLGTAVFLAAAAKYFGAPEYADCAIEIFSQVADDMMELLASSKASQSLPPLGFSGVGGFVWGADLLSMFLGTPAFNEIAQKALSELAPKAIEKHPGLDLMNGPAGLLYCVSRNSLQKAPLIVASSVHNLVDSCDYGDQPGWRTIEGELPLAGLAHGAAGILAALSKAAELGCNSEEVKRASDAGVRSMRAAFDPETKRWKDRRRRMESRSNDSWCHGTAGISLASVTSSAVIASPMWAEATESMSANPSVAGDSLCCGSAGVADVLYEAGLRRHSSRYTRAADKFVDDITDRWSRSGGLAIGGKIREPIRFPGLFQGSAGVGYLLLRSLEPATFPSILAGNMS